MKNLINLGNRHGDHQYIVDNDTGEVVTEADLLKEDLHTRTNLSKTSYTKTDGRAEDKS